MESSSTTQQLPSASSSASLASTVGHTIATTDIGSPLKDPMVIEVHNLESPNKDGDAVTRTQSKLDALMSLISSPRSTVTVPLPSYDELVKQINEQQLTDPQAMPPLYFADVMDCFRLYFGSSVTTFPFFASRLGALGFIVVACIGACLGLLTQMALHRARYNQVLNTMRKRMECQLELSKSQHVIEMTSGLQTPTSPIPTSVTTPTAAASPDPLHQSSPTTKKKKGSEDPSDMLPPFMGYNSIAKLCADLWPDHWMKDGITYTIAVSQFFGCCTYTLLWASNVAAILGIETSIAVKIGAVALGSLSLATSPTAKTFLAYINNIFIFGGACIVLFGSLTHDKTEAEEAMPLQILPKSVSDFAMYAPAVISYLAGQLYTLDVESIVARRAHRVMRGKEPEPSPESLANSPAVSCVSSPVSQFSASAFPVFPTNVTRLRADLLQKSLIVVQTVQACFVRAVNLGIVSSVFVLALFAELIMSAFRDNTNPIIALSFPEGAFRSTILVVLVIGLYACSILNITPISDLLDGICADMPQLEDFLIVKRIISRVCLFAFVVVFLWLVPFFDMVVALSGALCTPMFFFFIPVICEAQSEMHKVSAATDTKAKMATASYIVRLAVTWNNMSLKTKGTTAVSVVLGSTILIFSTATVLQEIFSRSTA